MEQKKILWVVVAISIFFLIIFGFALIMYSPSKYVGPNLQLASTQPTVDLTNLSNVEIQEPREVVLQNNELDKAEEDLEKHTYNSASSNINFTFVSNEQNSRILDVSELIRGSGKTSDTKETENKEDTNTTSLSLANGRAVGEVQTKKEPQTKAISQAKPSAPKVKDTGSTVAKKPSTTVSPPKTTVATKKTTPTPSPQKPTPKTITEYWIQTGSFSGKLNAEKARDSLNARYLKAEIFTKDVNGATTFRVRVGPYTSKGEADYWLGAIKEMPEFTGSYISEVKIKQ